MRQYPRTHRFRHRPSAPNNAIEEGHYQAGLGELPEDMMKERRLRPVIFSPRGTPGGLAPSDDPLSVPLGPPVQPPATRSYNPQTLSTYTVDVPAGVPTPIFASTRERSYSIIINGGPNPAVITYGREPSGAADGIPLAAAGVGFHELLDGTTGTVSAFSAAGTFLSITEGRFDPPMEY
ncbi:hypothetical protein EHM76_00350 [bacterium]|nr:MAG: hypothetical protein EHM76_00350 [bacterium]